MWSSLREYQRPRSLAQAVRLLQRKRPRTVALAGGSWLVGQRDPRVEAVVDLVALGLASMENRGDQLHVGAMCTLQALASHRHTSAFAGGLLAEAARRAAPRPIRNVATLGGMLTVGGTNDEVLLALLVLQGKVTLRTPALRTLPIEEFLDARSALRSRKVLIERVVLPAVPPRATWALATIAPTPGDRPIVDAAAVVVRSGDVLEYVRLAVGGVAPLPILLDRVAGVLIGRAPGDAVARELARAVAEHVNPEGDWRGSAAYRREMAGVVAVRALTEAWQRVAEA